MPTDTEGLELPPDLDVSPTGWKYQPLSQLVDESRGISYGIVQPGAPMDRGVPIVRVNNIKSGRIDTNDVLRVDSNIEEKYLRSRLQGGEVLLTLVGSLGESAVVPIELAGWNVARAVAVIPVRREIGSRWVELCLRSTLIQHYIRIWATTTVQATLNLRDVAKLPIPIPPRSEREAITQLLGALDDKIELNRRMNETLEAIAQAIFKSWFVDFDPVRVLSSRMPEQPPFLVKDNLQKIGFPDRFQDSELGEIPEGWEVLEVSDVATRIAMGPFGSRITRDNFVPFGVPVIRGNNLADGFHDREFVFLTEAKAHELKSAMAFPGDLVFTHRGTLGQVGIIPDLAKHPHYIVSQSQMLLSVKIERLSPFLVYEFFRSSQGRAELLAHTSTTGVPAIARPTTSLKAIRLVVPPKRISDVFDNFVRPIYLRRERNEQEIETLTALRDLLLPKLLSGELSVADPRLEMDSTI